MFDDLKATIEQSEMSTESKVALAVLLKAISWFPQVFFFVGIVLAGPYFIYWLVFFMIVEGGLLLGLVYVLTLLVKASIASPSSSPKDLPGEPQRGVVRRATAKV